MSSVGKLAELVAAAHWDLGLDFLGFTRALTASAPALWPWRSWHLLPALLVVFLGKVHDPQELGVHHLKRLMSLISRCCFCAVVGTVCAWCGSWTWPCLHWGLQILKCLGPDKKESR